MNITPARRVFRQAAQKEAQHVAAKSRTEQKHSEENLASEGFLRDSAILRNSMTTIRMGGEGLELQATTTIHNNDLRNLHSDGAAKSGAVGSEPAPNGANLDVLAAFVAVLSPEQRATLAKLLGG